nr:uncharacterized protein LOC119624247 [Chlorocebus sabaeus]
MEMVKREKDFCFQTRCFLRLDAEFSCPWRSSSSGLLAGPHPLQSGQIPCSQGKQPMPAVLGYNMGPARWNLTLFLPDTQQNKPQGRDQCLQPESRRKRSDR